MRQALDISKLEIGYYRKRGKTEKVAGPMNISINSGELICLIGPNGVGKTTLLRTLAGIQPSLSGGISILGENIAQFSKKKLAKFLSVVLTDRIGYGNLTSYDLIALGRTPHTGWFGNLGKEDRRKIQWAVESTNIHHLTHKSIHELSDGERQKVMITRALAQDTSLILLDEPTAHLDLPNRIDVVRLLRRLARKTEKAIIMSTHELDLALQAADKIWLMSLDNHTFSGAPEDLVLNDVFAKVFTKEGIEFDKGHGVFKVVEPHSEEIGLEGDNTGVFWTKRALERIGYMVTVNRQSKQRICVYHQNDTWLWVYADEGVSETFLTIEELSSHLKSKGGHL